MPIYLQHGNLIDYVPPTDTSTEDVVFMGGLVGIPQTFIPAGELGALSVDGVYMFTKKDGVSVNLGEVVKYCGTTKLAQDSNADLTLGVAVADAEADSLGVKVKINSVLPTDGGGGGGGEIVVGCGLDFCTNGELYVNADCGLDFNEYGQLYVATGCGLVFNDHGELFVNINTNCGLAFNSYGELIATGGGGGGGLENLATGEGSLSILGEATTSDLSTSVGHGANASECGSSAVGYRANARGEGSTAIGNNAYAGGYYSIALGALAKAFKGYSTALGISSNAEDNGVTVISAWDDSGSAKTQLYLIGAGSTMSTTYSDGEAGLGFMSKDSSNNILKRGTIKLSAIMTENTNTFNPSGW